MELGESVSMAQALQQDKCVICSQSHKEPKKEKIEETAPNDSGWQRKTMTGILEQISAKLACYPGNKFPPKYEYQGHHAMALSAFVKKADKPSRKDKRIRLNHFLKKVEFYPNREQNCIGLPARKHRGHFTEFWQSLDLKAPLQMHGPGHDQKYFAKVNQLITRMVSIVTHPDLCKELTKNEWEDQLRTAIKSAENYAFNRLAEADGDWCLHRNNQNQAMEIYKAPTGKEFEVRGSKKTKVKYMGRGNANYTLTFPKPNLDEGPFRGA